MISAPIRKISVLFAMVLFAAIGGSLTASGADRTKWSLPPGFSTSLTGSKHDFDYLSGAWTTRQKRLKALAVGNSDWLEAPRLRNSPICASRVRLFTSRCLRGAALVLPRRIRDTTRLPAHMVRAPTMAGHPGYYGHGYYRSCGNSYPRR